MTKLAVITDLHHSSAPELEGARDVRDLAASFAANAIDWGADLVLVLGDHIFDNSRDRDLAMVSEVATALSAFSGPRFHVLGNHDVVNLSRENSEAAFGQQLSSRAVDLGELRLVLWQPTVSYSEFEGFPSPMADLPWLVDVLHADPRPAIIASHVPVSGHSQAGNRYFELQPGNATYPDHVAIREAVVATGKAAIWLSGHVHQNTICHVHDTWHLTLQAALEKVGRRQQPANAYAFLEIENGSAFWTVFGRDTFHARFSSSGL